MYINTHSYYTIFDSICEYYSIDKVTFHYFLNSCRGSDENNINTEIADFITKNNSLEQIDEVLFFHLGRRLNNEDSKKGTNLFELLTTNTSLCQFLKKHRISFVIQEGHLEIYENGMHLSLEDSSKNGVHYLRRRLGYNNTCKDFCFNGFAFKDLVYKNSYARILFQAPEFIIMLSKFLTKPDMIEDYFSNSTYYCYEYLVPLEMVLFDEKEKMNQKEKVTYFLTKLLYKLIKYDIQTLNDDNLILRLHDNINMPSKFYCDHELITQEMIYPKYKALS